MQILHARPSASDSQRIGPSTQGGFHSPQQTLCSPQFENYFDVAVVQFLSCVWFFAAPWTAAHQAPLSSTVSQSLLKFMSTESMMPPNHLILCRPLLPSSIFPSIRVCSNKSALLTRWPKYWSFSFSISPSNEHPGLISFRRLLWSPCSPRNSQESSPAPQLKNINFFSALPSLRSNPHMHSWLLEKP